MQLPENIPRVLDARWLFKRNLREKQGSRAGDTGRALRFSALSAIELRACLNLAEHKGSRPSVQSVACISVLGLEMIIKAQMELKP